MLTAILLSMALFLRGQDLTLNFQRLSVEQGLSSQQYNHYIFEDSHHFVWVSSMNGLNRFDGKEVLQFHSAERDTNSIADEGIESDFFEDENGCIWFSTNGAIHCYNYQTGLFKRSTPVFSQKTEGPLAYHLLHYDKKKKNFWLVFSDTLAIFNPDSPSRLAPVDTLITLFGRALQMVESNDNYYLLAPHENGAQIRKYLPDGNLDWQWTIEKTGGTNCFYLENDSSLWFGSSSGLYHANLIEQKLKKIESIKLKNVSVTGIVSVDKQHLVISTWKNGIYLFDNSSGLEVGELLSLEGDKATPFQYPTTGLYISKDQVLWVQSEGRGIYFTSLKKRKFQTFLQSEPGVPPEYSHVGDITEDKKGRLWCLTRAGVIVLDNLGNRLHEFDRLSGPQSLLFGNDPFDIDMDAEGRIWVCNHAGLFVLTQPEGVFLPVPAPENLHIERPVFTFTTQLPSKRMLVGTLKSGLLEVVGTMNFPKLAKFEDLGEDLSGYVLAGTGQDDSTVVLSRGWKSILICSEHNGRLNADTTLLFTPFVTSIKSDPKRHCFWIGCSEGLYQLKKDKTSWTLKPFQAFPFDNVNSLEIDRKGNLWVSNNKGFGNISFSASRISGNFFSLEDGLQSLEFNSSSSTILKDGRLAFGGVNGVNLFDPSAVKPLDEKAHPSITNVSFNDGLPLTEENFNSQNSAFPGVTSIILKYSQNTLNLKFTALEYSAPHQNKYRISLVPTGSEANFSAATDRNDVTFFNLRENDYTFSLMASNSDGVWSDEIAILRIIVLPPWYRTWWFYSMVGLVVASFIYWYYRKRLAEVRKEESYKRELAELKQKEAEYKQLVAETETAILRLQMNPHFIFNSMNSINSYILKRDIGTAGEYLGRFSKLMRMILNLAAKKYISVYEEQELLELYIQTEAMRFEDKFSYEIRLGDDLDPNDVLIPTMILQPFVENAIWHGLSNKKGGGAILVEFKIEEESLLCAVEDNGIGRQAAADSQRGKKHESKALGITQKRLELMQKETGKQAGYQVVDLVEPDGSPAGTRVELIIPLI